MIHIEWWLFALLLVGAFVAGALVFRSSKKELGPIADKGEQLIKKL